MIILSLAEYNFVYTFIKSVNHPILTLPCNMSDFVYPFDFIQIKKSRFLYPLITNNLLHKTLYIEELDIFHSPFV